MYFLVDCNNFFVSCERVFRPDLNGRPVVVLSNNDGCVVARSNEAKAIGIAMGIPLFKIKEEIRLHDIQVFSSNYPLYADMSSRVMSILREEVGTINVYSIDEVFFQLEVSNEEARLFSEKLRRKIVKWVGIPVSIGVAPTMTLAKVASYFAKKIEGYHGICMIDNDEKRVKALKLLPISEIWGVGRRLSEKMRFSGIKTAYDFTQRTEEWAKNVGSILLVRTQTELRGKPAVKIDSYSDAQSLCTSRSFASVITDYSMLRTFVSNFAAKVAKRLREKKLLTSVLTIFIQTNFHDHNSPQYSNSVHIALPTPTNNTPELIQKSLQALAKIYIKGYSYKKAGVIASSIVSQDNQQYSLFEENPERRRKLEKLSLVMDELNRKSGEEVIQTAVQLYSDRDSLRNVPFKDQIKHDYRSNAYTTNWNELMEVK